MEIKKTPKADLEGKKGIFFEIGLVVALGILLCAFNWKANTKVEEGFVTVAEEPVEEEIIPITQQMMKPPPPPPPAPKLTDLIEMTKNWISMKNWKSKTWKLTWKTALIIAMTMTAPVMTKGTTVRKIFSK